MISSRSVLGKVPSYFIFLFIVLGCFSFLGSWTVDADSLSSSSSSRSSNRKENGALHLTDNLPEKEKDRGEGKDRKDRQMSTTTTTIPTLLSRKPNSNSDWNLIFGSFVGSNNLKVKSVGSKEKEEGEKTIPVVVSEYNCSIEISINGFAMKGNYFTDSKIRRSLQIIPGETNLTTFLSDDNDEGKV